MTETERVVKIALWCAGERAEKALAARGAADRRSAGRAPDIVLAVAARFGALSDAKLADEIGVKDDVVRYWRKKAGIPAFYASYGLLRSDVTTRLQGSTIAPFFVTVSQRPRREIVAACQSEEAAARFIRRIRWPKGIRCDRCGGEVKNIFTRPKLYSCRACSRQMSVVAGTILAHSKITYTEWMQIFLLVRDRGEATTIRDICALGVSMLTARLALHKIRAEIRGEGRVKKKDLQ